MPGGEVVQSATKYFQLYYEQGQESFKNASQAPLLITMGDLWAIMLCMMPKIRILGIKMERKHDSTCLEALTIQAVLKKVQRELRSKILPDIQKLQIIVPFRWGDSISGLNLFSYCCDFSPRLDLLKLSVSIPGR
jgi:hypothetical protein